MCVCVCICVCVCVCVSGWAIYNALIYNQLFIKDNSLVHKLWKQLWNREYTSH